MESSIAEFLKRQLACELLPTVWQMSICVNDMCVISKQDNRRPASQQFSMQLVVCWSHFVWFAINVISKQDTRRPTRQIQTPRHNPKYPHVFTSRPSSSSSGCSCSPSRSIRSIRSSSSSSTPTPTPNRSPPPLNVKKITPLPYPQSLPTP